MPTALITGIAGQDGSYLAEFLAEKNYELVGVIRPSRSNDPALDPLRELARLVPGDLSDPRAIRHILETSACEEIYNLAGITSLEESEQDPELNAVVNAEAPLMILDAISDLGGQRSTRFCQASSSQMFGPPDGEARNEMTPLNPHNNYARAKATVHRAVADRRANEEVFACSAILFNHESPRRSTRFVSRKISTAVAQIASAGGPKLSLRSLRSARDWSFAGDIVQGMWLMLQQETATDFVLASGTCRSVEEMVEAAFGVVGISLDGSRM